MINIKEDKYKKMINTEKIKELRSRAKLLEPAVRIGKNGLTKDVLLQISKVLDKRKLIKIKFLKAFLENNDRKKAAQEIIKNTRALLVEQVGFVIVIYKETPGNICNAGQKNAVQNREKRRFV